MKSQSAAMLWELIGRMANTCLTFRISGEMGVGKEAIARLIHRHYPAKQSTFTKIDCANLIRSENEDVTSNLKSVWDAPQNRVIYFESIEHLPSEMQGRLYQLLCSDYSATSPWVFAASAEPFDFFKNHPLSQDLMKALDTVHIAVPPLRKHVDKIPQILSWYANLASKENQAAVPAMPDENEMERLINYPWPGNLRQLQTVARKAFEISDWNKAIAMLDVLSQENAKQEVDEIAAIYLMSLAKLSIQREKILECLMMASKTEDMGLLDLAIYNEAVAQISDHRAPD